MSPDVHSPHMRGECTCVCVHACLRVGVVCPVSAAIDAPEFSQAQQQHVYVLR